MAVVVKCGGQRGQCSGHGRRSVCVGVWNVWIVGTTTGQ